MKKSTPTTTEKFQEVLGIIIPNAWDANGKVIAWAISTYNENLYKISMRNKIGKQLPQKSGKKIKAQGTLAAKSGKTATMTITDYTIIEDP